MFLIPFACVGLLPQAIQAINEKQGPLLRCHALERQYHPKCISRQ